MSVQTQQVNPSLMLSDELMGKIAIHKNTDQDVIVTTEDKVRICLLQHLKYFERRSAWIAPLGILLALVTTFLTSSFNNFYLDAATWRAIFLVSGVVTFGWLVYAVVCAFRSKGVDDIVRELKKGNRGME